MEITVRFFAQVSEWLQCREENIQLRTTDHTTMTVRHLLIQQAEKHGQPFRQRIYDTGTDELQPGIFMLLNGCHLARIGGLDAHLSRQDRLDILPVIEAG